ncbi:MAG: hypothetical protein KDJ16_08440 [Hyphomicrobiales bacterium]|nr:hypothetical protein [Hyphomicrobiales bacterium]
MSIASDPATPPVVAGTDERRKAARRRLPPGTLRRAVVFATAYGAALTAAVALDIALLGHAFGGRVASVIALFGAAGLVAGFLAWPVAEFVVGRQRPATARFAAMVVGLAFLTPGIAALIYFLQYRTYFAAFHDEAFTIIWVYQVLFTGAAAAFQFAVAGLRLLTPFGLVVLIMSGIAFARSGRRT